ncbi:hypothetical protein CAOG_04852 [Capsaspora owczarzaki ATCC 30864]|uniref:Oxidation resistance protein 1 n=1 Tax=Capsaspora owczarzaki (strain ATCC 30864) TaxID=595528 RepID=A0A0D2X3E5_CAPO3|nr:hypothetical protein CAOG_04852 [Capsaspora owczarzaki ATCC 30864]KJE94169.1 hypothetical protein CAOG_004852 [Capsaspora owczarzaki ATCC 30864]|eukprot:XP_004347603.2 hypothetical protein CAOG_04852 [Capsaspora owczarzaki ATCC 30864]
MKFKSSKSASSTSQQESARPAARSNIWDDIQLLNGEHSTLVDKRAVQMLAPYLPAHAQGWNWHMRYSTKRDGTSSHSMHRAASKYPGPSLCFIRDKANTVFGCFATHTWSLESSQHGAFYGTGECLLFKYSPKFAVYDWTQSSINNHFQSGQLPHDAFIMGAGDGKFGLWVDETLTKGTSVRCPTFDNEPLAATEAFEILDLELWVLDVPQGEARFRD